LQGKDFVLFVKEIQTGDETYPDYKIVCSNKILHHFLYLSKKRSFQNAPTVDGKIDPAAQGKVKTFLLDREHQLEEFEPKKLTEEQQTKITDITNYLTGKSSNSFAKSLNQHQKILSSNNFATSTTSTSTAASNGSEDEEFLLTFNSQVVNR
jgi:hypothetical protein